jgi:hypothetical protein
MEIGEKSYPRVETRGNSKTRGNSDSSSIGLAGIPLNSAKE